MTKVATRNARYRDFLSRRRTSAWVGTGAGVTSLPSARISSVMITGQCSGRHTPTSQPASVSAAIQYAWSRVTVPLGIFSSR